MGWSTNVYVTNNSLYTLKLAIAPATGDGFSSWNSGTYEVLNTTIPPLSELPILGFNRDVGIKNKTTYGMVTVVQFVDDQGQTADACILQQKLTGTETASDIWDSIMALPPANYNSGFQGNNIAPTAFAGTDGTMWRAGSTWSLNVGTLFDNLFYTLDSSPRPNAASPEIQHLFVLMLENRAFDHLLGFSGITGTDAVTGQPTSIDGLTGSESNSFNGQSYPVSRGADYVMPVDPAHEFTDVVEQLCGPGAVYVAGRPYPAINNSGFVADYVSDGGSSSPGEIMKCYDSASQLPVLYTLASEFAVCDQWHASLPGPTWPNRFFVAAGSSGGLDHSPDVAQQALWMKAEGFTFMRGTIFDQLTSANWRIYAGDDFPIMSALHGISVSDTVDYSQFASDVPGAYPWSFTFIEPNYGDFVTGSYAGGTSEHPCDDIRNGEGLIKNVYESLRNSPLWPNSLLIVTWDEHGGFYDHVAPPAAIPPGDGPVAPTPPDTTISEFGFNFSQYGVRVPAVVVSAYTPKNVIDHRLYDHSSIPATAESLFAFGPLTNRDANANNVTSLASLPAARTDAPPALPSPALKVAAMAEARLPAIDPATPLTSGNLVGFVHVALRADVALSPPEQRPAIEARVQAIKTRGQAEQYLNEVRQKIRASRAASNLAQAV